MRSSIAALAAFIVLACLFTTLAAAAATQPAIRLANYNDGEEIRFPVPIIRGQLSDADQTAVTITNTSSNRDTRQMNGLALKGQFKALIELVPGLNQLIIRSGKEELPFTLVYKPQTTPYIVRVVYLTDNIGNTQYQTPIENDPQDYANKLDTAMKIMQSFTAERNYDLNFGRRTFNLELDENGKVKVHVFKQPEPAAFYYAMNDVPWWGRVASELEKTLPTTYAKNVAVAAYTRLDPETGKVRGHTALGGGGLGLFGSGNLFTWPSKLADVQSAFMDTRPIDPKKNFSDSVGRHTFWGAASTTIGATLHEMSHTFGLPHTREPYDIMTRGFDHFNRAFTLVDPPCANNPKTVEFADTKVACFPPISAAALVNSRWFAMDDRSYNDQTRARVDLDEKGETIVIDSDSPVQYVGFDVKGDAVYHIVPAGQKHITITLAEVRQKVKSETFNIRVWDDQGRVYGPNGRLRTLLRGNNR
ncbi:MAG: metallopeptidase [Planctomycetota bacterium]|nr:metallopeptidase [Planctomycetota bacterium]